MRGVRRSRSLLLYQLRFVMGSETFLVSDIYDVSLLS